MIPVRGFLVDCYAGTAAGRPATYALGRLETGETFALIDDTRVPTLYIRADDAPRARRLKLTGTSTGLRTMDGAPVLGITAADPGRLPQLEGSLRRAGIRTYEGDANFALDFLVERGLRGTVAIEGEGRPSAHVGRVYLNPSVTPADWHPSLRVLSFDIETDVTAGDRILAISLVTYGIGPGFGVPALDAEQEEVLMDPDERALLTAFAARVKALDPDILTGWNILDFDVPMLAKRFAKTGVPWNLGRSRDPTPITGRRPDIPGRQMLDAMRLVRSALLRLEDLRLGTVAQALLGRGKTIEAESWEDKPAKLLATYESDPKAFAEYCLEDSRLVRDILRKEQLLELTVNRSRLIGLPLSQAWGSVAAFELIYRSELRRQGRVAPSHGVDRPPAAEVAGGLVLEPQPGLHPHILVFDFKSLYPSIIRTFNIDPLALAEPGKDALKAPNGARFARARGILPEVLDRFFDSRAAAQARGDKVAAYAYKIIMNSFYGVLGTDSCRFAAPELAGAITSFGHELLRWTRSYMESVGTAVLYGDTDSLFVDPHFPDDVTAAFALERGATLAASANAALAAHLTKTYGVPSRLELKFEKYYRWLLLPHSRGGTTRAKSYAGLRQDENGERVEVTGMEAVRSDWTPLARGLQRELLGMLFSGAGADALESRVRTVIKDLAAGKCDEGLVYRKAIRKPLASYTSTTPPHVKAARLLPRAPRVVRYLMTTAGPQPVGFVTAPVDHAHYAEKQLLPIVETFAALAGFDPEAACRLPGSGGLFGD